MYVEKAAKTTVRTKNVDEIEPCSQFHSKNNSFAKIHLPKVYKNKLIIENAG